VGACVARLPKLPALGKVTIRSIVSKQVCGSITVKTMISCNLELLACGCSCIPHNVPGAWWARFEQHSLARGMSGDKLASPVSLQETRGDHGIPRILRRGGRCSVVRADTPASCMRTHWQQLVSALDSATRTYASQRALYDNGLLSTISLFGSSRSRGTTQFAPCIF
jgi:hypothetical protein